MIYTNKERHLTSWVFRIQDEHSELNERSFSLIRDSLQLGQQLNLNQVLTPVRRKIKGHLLEDCDFWMIS